MTEKVKGCFLGLAVGDALGVPVEFRDRSYFLDHPVNGMLGYGTWNQPPGTWSDDSSLSFCLAESLAGGYDVTDIGRKYVEWYTNGYWGAHHKLFDVGGATEIALIRIREGEDPRFAGELDEGSNGNGSLMRIAPASLYFSDETDEILFENIREISSITHGHFRSVFGCFIFSIFLAELFKGQVKSAAYKTAIARVNAFAKKNQFNANELKLFERVLTGILGDVEGQAIESSGYILHTLEASVWCFLTTDSYSEAVLKAVNLGGDTDSTACVTGAMAGLYYGSADIPAEWLKVLARKDDIVRLSERFSGSMNERKTLHSDV